MKTRNWIFIRGLGRAAEHWEPFTSIFKKHFPQDNIELADIRGNGKLNYSPSFLSIAENVRDLRSRSQFIKDGKKVSLMTISLGSMIGIEWAKLFPNEVEELVLMNTSDGSASLPHERLRPGLLKNILPLIQSYKIKDEEVAKTTREKIILQMTTNKLENLEEKAKEWRDFPESSPLNLAKQLVAASLFRIPEKIQAKTLMLYSTQDCFVNPVCTERIAKKWGLTPIAHPTAGHDLPLEAPQWVVEKTADWLKN